jgi:anionic cell wall polymer biosynthesis LytR-Cps2A-Psr (LCP) family protein
MEKKKRSRPRVIILLLLLIAIPLIVYYLVAQAWRSPLDKRLNVDTSGESFCGHTQSMQVLFLLTDRSESGTSDRLLALRLVEADFPNQTVASIYFPKELNLTIGALADVGFDQIRLDEIYRVGMEMQDNDVAAATNLVAQALYDTFGVLPDHYVTLDLTSLADLIDAIGGVDVEILEAYDASAVGLGQYYKGVVHMDGDEALTFSAAASPLARWDGLERQTQVLKGLRDEALDPSNLLKAPELIASFRQAVTTDLSPELGTDLICLAEAVTPDQITFYGVDDTYVIPSTDGSLAPRSDRIEELLLEAFGN